MTKPAAPVSGSRVFYRDIKPYEVPARLEDLCGPRAGELVLPINVYWGPEATVDLNTQGGIIKAYQATLREGRLEDQLALLNKDLLVQVWGSLVLPVRVRYLWEIRFPELVLARQDGLVVN